MRTRAGTDALAFALRTATDKDPDAVILSLDGIGAYDHIRRRAMLGKLYDTPELQTLLPFVREFYGEPSEYLWTDDGGTTHHIPQGEGGEQGEGNQAKSGGSSGGQNDKKVTESDGQNVGGGGSQGSNRAKGTEVGEKMSTNL